MKHYYQDDWVTIYHGDCREIMPELPKADLVLTDIPYGEVNRTSGGLRNLNKGLADTVTIPTTKLPHLLNSQSVYIFCGTEQISELRKQYVLMGFSTRLCIWEKTNPSPMNGEYLWLSSIESCLFARKDGACFSEHCASPVWRCPTEHTLWHPTQKPLKLIKRLINASSTEKSIILDPFLGSGTTCVAAKQLNRHSIGIEMEEKYCEIAAKRCSQEVLNL